MSLALEFLPEAKDDIDAAYVAYERVSSGLGEQFLEMLRLLLQRIADSPSLYGNVTKEIRAAPLRRFPYVVYYRVETDRIVVIAVQHGRRSSRSWQSRG